MVAAKEDADIQEGASIELTELQALVHVAAPIASLDHRHEMHAFEPPGLLQEAGSAKQAARLLDRGEKVEEGADMLVEVLQHRGLHGGDAGQVGRAQIDERLPPGDIRLGQVDDARAQLLVQHAVLPGLRPIRWS